MCTGQCAQESSWDHLGSPAALLPTVCACLSQVDDVSEALAAHALKEHNTHMQFVVFFFKKVLQVQQNAKSMVHSYPYYPDPLAIANHLEMVEATAQVSGGASTAL